MESGGYKGARESMENSGSWESMESIESLEWAEALSRELERDSRRYPAPL